jgi:hypothetical protein
LLDCYSAFITCITPIIIATFTYIVIVIVIVVIAIVIVIIKIESLKIDPVFLPPAYSVSILMYFLKILCSPNKKLGECDDKNLCIYWPRMQIYSHNILLSYSLFVI